MEPSINLYQGIPLYKTLIIFCLISNNDCSLVVKYCISLSGKACNPESFANSSVLKGNSSHDNIIFYSPQIKNIRLAVSCISTAPTTWILSLEGRPNSATATLSSNRQISGTRASVEDFADGQFIPAASAESSTQYELLSERSTIMVTNGTSWMYAADIELQGFISGTLKCQSYDQMSQAAEMYVDWGDPLSLEYRGKGVPRGLQYFLVDQAGNESSPKAIVPCQLLHLDSSFIHRKFALRKYKDSMWQWTRAIFREYTSLPSSDQFQPVPDCNGDQLSMCSDVFANISDTCRPSNNLIAEANFEDVEYCLVQATGSVVEGQYDPRIGFYVDSVDYDHVYVCPMVRGSRPLFLAPVDPGLRRTPTVTIEPDSIVKSELTLTCEMGKSLKRDTTMILKAMPCSHLSYCQTLFDNFGNLEHLRNGLVGVQASSKKVGNNITRVVLAQAASPAAAVICTGFAGLNQPFVHYVNFYFTALDSRPYLISDALPPKAIISLESIVPMGANGSTGTIPTRKFTCTVSTFILFPFFQYTVYFSNRTVINVTKETVKLPNKLSSVRDENGRASQTLTMDFSADVVKVACGSSFRNSLQWASASIDVSSMELGRMSTTFLMPMTIAGILVVLLSAFCGIFAAIRYREAQNLRGLTLAEIEEFFNGTKVAMPSKAQTVNEVNVDALGFTSNFHIGSSDLKIYDEQVLGQGEFGLCIKGDFRGETVAVKMTKDSMDVCSFKDFLREVKIMAYVGAHPHPHVVHFHGAVVDNLTHRTCLAIIEFGPYGDLLGYLRHDKSEYVFALGCLEDQLRLQNVPKLEFVDLCYFCEQIASAMDFIGEKKVLHGDLAARNVLVFPNNVVKISDFGLSRRLYDAYKYQTPLPWRWMAIESLKLMEFSAKSDMWAYGVTVWEIFSRGQVPYAGMRYTSGFVSELGGDLRLDQPAFATKDVHEFMMNTWDKDPRARPSFADAKEFFRELGRP